MTETVLESPPNESVPAGPPLQRLFRSKYVLFLAIFGFILTLKWSTLTEPPVWDAAMSVFPAAITLEERAWTTAISFPNLAIRTEVPTSTASRRSPSGTAR